MRSRISQWLVERLRPRGFHRIRLSAFLVVPILAACSDSTGPTRFVSITPASQTVVLQTVPTGQVLHTSVTVTNTSPFLVTRVGPCGVTLEKRTPVSSLANADGPPEWFTVWSQICALLSAEAMAIIYTPLKPGQSVSVPIDVPVTATGSLGFDGSPGLYRVHLSLATQIFTNQYRSIPHDQSVSNPFSVVPQ